MSQDRNLDVSFTLPGEPFLARIQLLEGLFKSAVRVACELSEANHTLREVLSEVLAQRATLIAREIRRQENARNQPREPMGVITIQVWGE